MLRHDLITHPPSGRQPSKAVLAKVKEHLDEKLWEQMSDVLLADVS